MGIVGVVKVDLLPGIGTGMATLACPRVVMDGDVLLVARITFCVSLVFVRNDGPILGRGVAGCTKPGVMSRCEIG